MQWSDWKNPKRWERLQFWKRHEPPMPAPDDPDWERALINRMALEFLRERRRSHRWGMFFRLSILLYLVILAIAFATSGIGESLRGQTEHTALIEVRGPIAPRAEASADRLITALRKAFEADKAKGIVLRINSPGGSPVQSGYVFDEIRRLKEKHPDKPIYAVAADVCASGAYYIAVATDEIYVDRATLIGSIGVRLDSFGFDRAMEDLGIQRRLLTAGEHKGILDPFSPLVETDKEFLQARLDQLHTQFIDAVRQGRGERLRGGDELFSGLFWTGAESVELGLSDHLGSSAEVAREVIGAENIVVYTERRDLLERLGERVGSALADSLGTLLGLGGMPALR